MAKQVYLPNLYMAFHETDQMLYSNLSVHLLPIHESLTSFLTHSRQPGFAPSNKVIDLIFASDSLLGKPGVLV